MTEREKLGITFIVGYTGFVCASVVVGLHVVFFCIGIVAIYVSLYELLRDTTPEKKTPSSQHPNKHQTTYAAINEHQWIVVQRIYGNLLQKERHIRLFDNEIEAKYFTEETVSRLLELGYSVCDAHCNSHSACLVFIVPESSATPKKETTASEESTPEGVWVYKRNGGVCLTL
jgi:hypothetical protein